MASNGRELLGEHYEKEHLTYEEIEGLGLDVVTENGETISREEMRGMVFRISDPDEPSGYVVKSMEDREAGTVLCYLQAS